MVKEVLHHDAVRRLYNHENELHKWRRRLARLNEEEPDLDPHVFAHRAKEIDAHINLYESLIQKAKKALAVRYGETVSP